ncbi:hypothetical protein Ppb6_00490 [Photorhabdus australis subsp. thailandensis]|uniref:Uncharacterized protein n=1 Tax=Photorhabdus australis subsp. thailandensis TaxID=2805096 RepID=A0A1C0U8E9_9GAMM|nr:hypothetical protein Ppb6_00490 [Photorhabdus australis subsp. thailandensis]
MIYVKNLSDNVVKVAISKWSSKEGNDEYSNKIENNSKR